MMCSLLPLHHLQGRCAGICVCDNAAWGKWGYRTAWLSYCNQSTLMGLSKTGYTGWLASVMHGHKSHSLSMQLRSE